MENSEKIIVVVPTLWRPANAKRMADTFFATTAGYADLLFVLDEDDEQNYERIDGVRYTICPNRASFAAQINQGLWENPDYGYILPTCDDHIFNTQEWDRKMIDAIKALGGTGMAFANDLHQGPNMPTAGCISMNMPLALGYLVDPVTDYLSDLIWREMTRDLGIITYLPDVIMEHLHPHAGKSEIDATYEIRASQDAGSDVKYANWCANIRPKDIDKLRPLVRR